MVRAFGGGVVLAGISRAVAAESTTGSGLGAINSTSTASGAGAAVVGRERTTAATPKRTPWRAAAVTRLTVSRIPRFTAF